MGSAARSGVLQQSTALHRMRKAADPTGKVSCGALASSNLPGMLLRPSSCACHYPSTSNVRVALRSAGDRAAVAAELATAAKSGSIQELVASGVFTSISASLADAKNANGREGGLLAIAALAGSVGRPAEPYLMPLLGQVLGLLADKAAPVRTAAASAQVGLVQDMGACCNGLRRTCGGRACFGLCMAVHSHRCWACWLAIQRQRAGCSCCHVGWLPRKGRVLNKKREGVEGVLVRCGRACFGLQEDCALCYKLANKAAPMRAAATSSRWASCRIGGCWKGYWGAVALGCMGIMHCVAS